MWEFSCSPPRRTPTRAIPVPRSRRSTPRTISRHSVPTFNSASATSRANAGDIEGAIRAYRHALQIDPDFAVVRFQLAQAAPVEG